MIAFVREFVFATCYVTREVKSGGKLPGGDFGVDISSVEADDKNCGVVKIAEMN